MDKGNHCLEDIYSTLLSINKPQLEVYVQFEEMHFKKGIDQWRRVRFEDLKIGDVSPREKTPEEQN